MVDEFGKRLRFEYVGQADFEKFRTDIKEAKTYLVELGKTAEKIKSTAAAVKSLSTATSGEDHKKRLQESKERIQAIKEEQAQNKKALQDIKDEIALERALADQKNDSRRKEAIAEKQVRDKRIAEQRERERLAADIRKREAFDAQEKRKQSDADLARFQKVENDKQKRRIRSLEASETAARKQELHEQRIAAAAQKTAIAQQNALNQQTAAQQRQAAAARRYVAQQILDQDRIVRSQKLSQQQALRAQQQTNASLRIQNNAITTAIGRTVRFFLLFKTVQESIRLGSQAIRESVDFASLLEESEIQIAGLLLSVGQIRDSFGETVDVASAMPDAIKLSGSVIKDLQKDAVNTAATFKELLAAFQVSTAPGLANGLDLDQIRELTVKFSQAAQALGVEQTALAEEIRSTFQGSINIRNTRIAVALGISNEDIRAAKEAGNLYGFLQERLSGVAGAANLLQDKLSLLKSNFQDVLLIAGAQGIQPLFEELKDLFRDLIGVFDEGSLEDGIQIKATTVARIEQAASGLKEIVAGVREFINSENSGDIVQELADGFSSLTKAIGENLPELILGISQVFATFTKITAGLVRVLSLLPDWFIQLGTVMAAISPYLRIFTGLIGKLAAILGNGFLGRALLGFTTGLGPLGLAIAAAVYILSREFSPAMTEAEQRTAEASRQLEIYKDRIDQAKAKLISTRSDIQISADFLESFAEKLKKANDESAKFGISDAASDQLDILKQRQEVLKRLEDDRAKTQREILETQQRQVEASESLTESQRELAEATSERDIAQSRYDASTRLVKAVSLAVDDPANSEAVQEANRRQASSYLELANAQEKYNRVVKQITDESGESRYLEEIAEKQKRLRDEFEKTVVQRRRLEGADNRSVPSNRDEISKQEIVLKKKIADLTDAAAGSDERRSRITLILTSAAADYISYLNLADKYQRELLANDKERLEVENQIKDLQKKAVAFEDPRSKVALSSAQSRLEAVQAELELSRAKSADPENKTLEIDFELRKKNLGITKEIAEVEEVISFFRKIGVEETNPVVERLLAQVAALRQVLTIEQSIAVFKREQANREEPSDREQRRIRQAELELSIREKEFEIEKRSIDLRSSADSISAQAIGARQEFEAKQKSLEVEIAISKLNQEFLRDQEQLIREQIASTTDRQELLALEEKLLGVRLSSRSALAEEVALKAQQAQEARREVGRLNPFAGFKEGLQSSSDAREPGTLAAQLGEQVTQSLGESLKAALLGQGDAIAQFAGQLGNAVLDALTQALAGKIAGFILSLLGSGGAATGASSAAPVVVPGVGQMIGNFDSGGAVPGPNMPKALPGHHPSDTTLIAAARDEHVLTRKTSLTIGHEFLASLDRSVRRGVLSGEQARAAIQDRIRRNKLGLIQGHSGGGPVGSARPQVTQYGSRTINKPNSTLFVASPEQVATLMNNPMFSALMRHNKARVGIDKPEYM